jgi:predicted transcriptional regulator
MKRWIRTDTSWSRKNQPAREPLYTVQEIADRIGMDYDTLRNYIRGNHKKCPPPPKPTLVFSPSPMRGRIKLYKLSEYKAWLKLRLDSINQGASDD